MSAPDKLSILIDGASLAPPTEWPEIRVSAIVEQDEFQPRVSTEAFEFTGSARDKIHAHVQDGNIFEGIPLEMSIASLTEALSVFQGMIDLTDEYEERDPDPKTGIPQRVFAKIKKLNGIETFRDLMGATTAADLVEDGFITSKDYQDIKYIVSDLRELPFKTAFAIVLIYETVQKIQETIARIADRISNTVAHTGGGVGGPAVGPIYSIAVIAIEIAFVAVMAAQSINVATEVIAEVLGVVRKHKGISIRKYFTKAAESRGYSFSSPIDDLDWVILPSNLNTNTGVLNIGNKSVSVGVPAAGDPGYNLGDMMTIMEQMFNAQFFISGKDVTFRTLSDDFWRQNTTFTLPNVRLENKKFNTQDIVANRAITFATDLQDDFTIDNYKGASVTVNTDLANKTSANLSRITGFEDIQIPYALGNRKDKLNILEEVIKAFAQGIDSLLDVFGVNSSLVDKVNDRKGLLKVSSPYHSVAKLLKMNGALLDSKYRSQLSAPYIYNKYHSEKSFVLNAERRQRVIYENINITFRLSNFIEILENTVFQLPDGRFGKLTSVDWALDKDSADVSFYIEDKYTDNLKEKIFIA